jgi:hypothetical protein
LAEHGRILDVTSERVGDQLAAAAYGSDIVLQLDDASPFSQTGGTAEIFDDINSEVVEYTSVDLDTDQMTLATGLVNSYAIETPIILSPEALVTWASVRLDWDDDRPVRARIPYSMKAQLAEGIRDETIGEGESVLVELEASQWFVVDILGASPGINAGFIDPSTIIAVGVRLYKEFPQTIANGDNDPITWTLASYDPQGMWSLLMTNTRITVPYPGHYRVSCNLSIDKDSNQHSKSIAAIRTNGSSTTETRGEHIGHDNPGGYSYTVADTLDLETGDYVEIYFQALDENHQLQEGPAATSITVDYLGQ